MNTLRSFILLLAYIFGSLNATVSANEISFTIDDPEVSASPLFSAQERDERILAAFRQFGIRGALFVCGMRVDSSFGRELLARWDSDNHLIANHSYSHFNYNQNEISFEAYRADFLRSNQLLHSFRNFSKLFRFPYLKEGETVEKRDLMRATLARMGYRPGYVSIDASDWYVDMRLRQRLAEQPNADLAPYRDFYFRHILDRARFYNGLARKVLGREIKHTLLLHHNLLNALFLADLMARLNREGLKLISAHEAYADPVFSEPAPNILPAGESLIWARAKAQGINSELLRYPAEDGSYEAAEMDRLGL